MFTFNYLSFFFVLLFITITIHHFHFDEQLATKRCCVYFMWLCLIFLKQTHTFRVHATLRIMEFWMLCVSYTWFVHCCCLSFVYWWSRKNVMCWTKRYAKNNNYTDRRKKKKHNRKWNFKEFSVWIWECSMPLLYAVCTKVFRWYQMENFKWNTARSECGSTKYAWCILYKNECFVCFLIERSGGVCLLRKKLLKFVFLIQASLISDIKIYLQNNFSENWRRNLSLFRAISCRSGGKTTETQNSTAKA